MKSWWFYAGLAGFLGYVPGLPIELVLLNLCFLWPLIAGFIRRRRQPRTASTDVAPPQPDLPLPAVAGGNFLFMTRVIVSQIVALLSPVMWPQIARQTAGQSAAESRVVDAAAQYTQKVRYRLPFDGEWYVFNGGVTPATSHSWEIAGQRFAYDFVIADEAYRRWRTEGDGRGANPADYLCYGVPVLSPADGEVVAIRDGLPDAPAVGTGWIDPFSRHFPGNIVTIRHAEGEYSFFAHLVAGSIVVHPGDRVVAGQMIGRCGHSGHSTEPHLHFHMQDTADFWTAAGLPVAFDAVAVRRADGCSVEGHENGLASAMHEGQPAVYPVRGTWIRSAISSAHG